MSDVSFRSGCSRASSGVVLVFGHRHVGISVLPGLPGHSRPFHAPAVSQVVSSRWQSLPAALLPVASPLALRLAGSLLGSPRPCPPRWLGWFLFVSAPRPFACILLTRPVKFGACWNQQQVRKCGPQFLVPALCPARLGALVSSL